MKKIIFGFLISFGLLNFSFGFSPSFDECDEEKNKNTELCMEKYNQEFSNTKNGVVFMTFVSSLKIYIFLILNYFITNNSKNFLLKKWGYQTVNLDFKYFSKILLFESIIIGGLIGILLLNQLNQASNYRYINLFQLYINYLIIGFFISFIINLLIYIIIFLSNSKDIKTLHKIFIFIVIIGLNILLGFGFLYFLA